MHGKATILQSSQPIDIVWSSGSVQERITVQAGTKASSHTVKPVQLMPPVGRLQLARPHENSNDDDNSSNSNNGNNSNRYSGGDTNIVLMGGWGCRCGQGFSGSSLGIHQPKCQQKWLAEQAAKPAGQPLLSPRCPPCPMAMPDDCYICQQNMQGLP